MIAVNLILEILMMILEFQKFQLNNLMELIKELSTVLTTILIPLSIDPAEVKILTSRDYQTALVKRILIFMPVK